jgi:hypothetical protein
VSYSGATGPASLGSRRKPYPYDIVLNGVGLILRPQDEGLMIGRKMQTLAQVAPITYDYSSQPVYAERTFAFRKIQGGYGERVQSSPPAATPRARRPLHRRQPDQGAVLP